MGTRVFSTAESAVEDGTGARWSLREAEAEAEAEAKGRAEARAKVEARDKGQG